MAGAAERSKDVRPIDWEIRAVGHVTMQSRVPYSKPNLILCRGRSKLPYKVFTVLCRNSFIGF